NGRLYDMGGYPMLVEGEGGLVKGEIVTVPDGRYTAVLARLDALERYNPTQPQAPGYRRLARKAVLTDSRSLTAWAYVGQEALVDGRPLVENGDWATYVEANRDRRQTWPTSLNIVYGLHRPLNDEK
ncbi:MAG: gamma-glutamylcyclotransferase, partial [Chloroflexi bacterium]|nr:gamma-glutamylcyclotransferase [Chloroflexota bacterium]